MADVRGMAPSYPFAGSLLVDRGEDLPLMMLNPSARSIWEGLAAGQPPRTVATRLAAAFGLPADVASGHVSEAQALWRDSGMFQGCGSQPETAAPRAAEAPAAWARRPRRETRRIYDLCGTPIAVTFDPPSLRSLAEPRFGYCESPGARPAHALLLRRIGDTFQLQSGGRVVVETGSEEELFGEFVGCVLDLSHGSPGWLALLHAAAVRSPGSWNIAIPGTNGRGKSTLVAGLVQSGYGYYSDDCVPIGPLGEVFPAPFAICLKRGSWPLGRRWWPNLDAAPIYRNQHGVDCRYMAPARICRRPGRLHAIVFPGYADAAATTVRRLDPTETLKLLLSARTWVSRVPRHLKALLRLLEDVPAFALAYGSLDAARDALAGVEDTLAAGSDAP